jgi:hypothetical protein
MVTPQLSKLMALHGHGEQVPAVSWEMALWQTEAHLWHSQVPTLVGVRSVLAIHSQQPSNIVALLGQLGHGVVTHVVSWEMAL